MNQLSHVVRRTASLLPVVCLAWISVAGVGAAGTAGGHSWGRASTWQVVPSPNPGQDVNDVVAVAAIGGNDVWTVGWRRNASVVYRTMTQHFDGSAWHIVTSPN